MFSRTLTALVLLLSLPSAAYAASPERAAVAEAVDRAFDRDVDGPSERDIDRPFPHERCATDDEPCNEPSWECVREDCECETELVCEPPPPCDETEWVDLDGAPHRTHCRDVAECHRVTRCFRRPEPHDVVPPDHVRIVE